MWRGKTTTQAHAEGSTMKPTLIKRIVIKARSGTQIKCLAHKILYETKCDAGKIYETKFTAGNIF